MGIKKDILNIARPILLPFKNFFLNIIYLFKYNLELHYISRENINAYLDNIKYEIDDDLQDLKKPLIFDPITSIEKILSDKISISRFGDGEFELLNNRPILFQDNSPLLAQRLKEILISDDPSIGIGIPHYYWHSLSNCNDVVKNFTRKTISHVRKEYENDIVFNKQYFSTEFTQLYMTYHEGMDMNEYFEKIKEIWNGRDITIIQGEGITQNFKYDIFENALSKQYLLAPSKNAFNEYESLLQQSLTISKDRLVLIILGPTATVLAYDLAKAGYTALDMGHTSKDYDFYKKGVNKTLNNLNNFYSPD